jgi:hypothetical protein
VLLRRCPTPFTQRERLCAEFVLHLDLREPLARGVVVMLGRFTGKFQRSLLQAVGEIGDLRRHTGEGGRVPFDPDAEITPKALVGGPATQRLSQRLHGRPAFGFQDCDRRALDLAVRDVIRTRPSPYAFDAGSDMR